LTELFSPEKGNDRAADALVAAAGWTGQYRTYPFAGGANNRVYRLEGDGFSGLLKSYFYHENDPRDRLNAEFSFSSFAWSNGVRSLPRPLACDRKNRLALYEFLPGRRLAAAEIDEEKVNKAIRFYGDVNNFRNLPAARELPVASEAAFSIKDHLQRVDRRLARLLECEKKAPVDFAADRFLTRELSEAWSRALETVHRGCDEMALSLESEIGIQDRILSPSDFGFHNALLLDESRLCFIDFEYAGWDDPAKLVCDFFCQPEVPVPFRYFERFRDDIIGQLTEPGEHAKRIAILLPVYQIKWCCILLNDFLPVDGARRRFATSYPCDLEKQKSKQLEKAQAALRGISVPPTI
jgi:hypothetical protein